MKCHSCRNHGTIMQYLQFFLELNFFSCRSLHPHETILLGVISTRKWTTYHVRCINVTQGNNPYFNYLFTSFMRMLFTTPISIKVFIVPIDTGRKLNVHKTFRRLPGIGFSVIKRDYHFLDICLLWGLVDCFVCYIRIFLYSFLPLTLTFLPQCFEEEQISFSFLKVSFAKIHEFAFHGFLFAAFAWLFRVIIKSSSSFKSRFNFFFFCILAFQSCYLTFLLLCCYMVELHA